MRGSWIRGAFVGFALAMIVGRYILELRSLSSIARVGGAGLVIGGTLVCLQNWLSHEKGQH